MRQALFTKILTVYEFRYTKMWQAMKEAGLPETLEEAVERVKISRSSSEGFAFLGKISLAILFYLQFA
jgi:hypothetical protein